MIKQLLTALLIAGLSATAKAEPTVYYCNMTALVKVDADGTVNKYTPERFTMKVEGRTVSFGGDGYMGGSKGELEQSFDPEIPSFWSVDGKFAFVDNVLIHSQRSAFGKDKFVISFIARCEDF